MIKENNNNNGNKFEEPDFFKSSSVKLRGKRSAVLSLVTFIIIIVISGIFAVFSKSRGKTYNPVKDAVGWEILRIDGNRNGKYVNFDHETHKALTGKGKEGCRACHHLSKPHDGPSSCYQCHMDMEKPVSIFDHNYHSKIHINKKSCEECHPNNQSGQNAKTCSACHEEYREDMRSYFSARGYKDAMHTQCLGCHKEEDQKIGENILSDCSVCHGN